jgi:hypothetical protein
MGRRLENHDIINIGQWQVSHAHKKNAEVYIHNFDSDTVCFGSLDEPSIMLGTRWGFDSRGYQRRSHFLDGKEFKIHVPHCNRVTFISFILSYLRHTSLMFCFPFLVLHLYLFLFYFIFQDSLLVDYKSCS